jgi:hypothetical protein
MVKTFRQQCLCQRSADSVHLPLPVQQSLSPAGEKQNMFVHVGELLFSVLDV